MNNEEYINEAREKGYSSVQELARHRVFLKRRLKQKGIPYENEEKTEDLEFKHRVIKQEFECGCVVEFQNDNAKIKSCGECK